MLTAALLCGGSFTLTLTGCKSVNTAAFKATSVVAASVEGARQGYDDYLAHQKSIGAPVPLEQQRQVREVWNQYQLALTAVTDAGKNYQKAVADGLDTSDYKAKLALASVQISVASANFIAIVNQFGIKF